MPSKSVVKRLRAQCPEYDELYNRHARLVEAARCAVQNAETVADPSTGGTTDVAAVPLYDVDNLRTALDESAS